MSRKKIIVLTPVKNEERILEAFLSITLSFADHIILAYQPSIDNTLEIARRFHRVDIINNNSEEFNEKERAELLVKAAREKYGTNCILIGLDADEIIMPQMTTASEWDKIRSLAPGTTIEFEKPDLLPGGKNCVRFPENYSRLGYADDGCAFEAKIIHTQRVPLSSHNIFFKSDLIKFLHVNLIRGQAHAAKRRFYACIEAIYRTQPWHRRALAYRADINWARAGVVEPLPSQWLRNLKEQTFNLLDINDEPPFWHDFEVLKLMREHGQNRLWWEDIWTADWESIRLEGKRRNYDGLPDVKIIKPPLLISYGRVSLTHLIAALRKVKRMIAKAKQA